MAKSFIVIHLFSRIWKFDGTERSKSSSFPFKLRRQKTCTGAEDYIQHDSTDIKQVGQTASKKARTTISIVNHNSTKANQKNIKKFKKSRIGNGGLLNNIWTSN